MGNSRRVLVIGLGTMLLVAIVIALTGSDGTGPEAATPSDRAAPATVAPTIAAAASDSPATSITATTTSTPATTTTADVVDEAIGDLLTSMDDPALARQTIATGINGDLGLSRLLTVDGTACFGALFVTESHGNWVPTTDPAAASAVIDSLRDADTMPGCAALPLIATDAELGSIVRVPIAAPPGAETYAADFDGNGIDVMKRLFADTLTYATALRAMGIDVNFGTVADIDTDPDNFMARSGRTFGSTDAATSALTAQMVAAQCEAGLAATLKHFPNQGATVGDPHEQITDGGTAADWRRLGMRPYENTTAPLVMTGHIFLDVDPARPASLSHAITTGILRDELGYDGVIITDDLSTMRGAIDVIAEPGPRGVAAISAGADVVLFVRDSDVPAVVDAMVDEMTTDPAFRASVIDSVGRVLRLKAAMGRLDTASAADVPLCG